MIEYTRKFYFSIPLFRGGTTGGKIIPKEHRIAIPKGIRRNKFKRIGPSQKPARILRKKNVFIFENQGKPGIFQVNRRRGSLKLLYGLSPRPVKIKPRLALEELVNQQAPRLFRAYFPRKLRKAVQTTNRRT